MELQASTLMESMYLYGQILLYTNMVNNLNIRITYKNRNDVSVMSCFAMYYEELRPAYWASLLG